MHVRDYGGNSSGLPALVDTVCALLAVSTAVCSAISNRLANTAAFSSSRVRCGWRVYPAARAHHATISHFAKILKNRTSNWASRFFILGNLQVVFFKPMLLLYDEYRNCGN